MSADLAAILNKRMYRAHRRLENSSPIGRSENQWEDGRAAKRKMPGAMAGAPGKSGQQYTA
jgi:hypothetical protein